MLNSLPFKSTHSEKSYRLKEKIGEGNFGWVYLAEDLTSDKKLCAIKVKIIYFYCGWDCNFRKGSLTQSSGKNIQE